MLCPACSRRSSRRLPANRSPLDRSNGGEGAGGPPPHPPPPPPRAGGGGGGGRGPPAPPPADPSAGTSVRFVSSPRRLHDSRRTRSRKRRADHGSVAATTAGQTQQDQNR